MDLGELLLDFAEMTMAGGCGVLFGRKSCRQSRITCGSREVSCGLLLWERMLIECSLGVVQSKRPSISTKSALSLGTIAFLCAVHPPSVSLEITVSTLSYLSGRMLILLVQPDLR